MPKESRIVERTPFSHHITFDSNALDSDSFSVGMGGKCIDISPAGLGLVTGYLLKKGAVLRLNLPMDSVEAAPPVYAKVMWTKVDGGLCRAGLKFIV